MNENSLDKRLHEISIVTCYEKACAEVEACEQALQTAYAALMKAKLNKKTALKVLTQASGAQILSKKTAQVLTQASEAQSIDNEYINSLPLVRYANQTKTGMELLLLRNGKVTIYTVMNKGSVEYSKSPELIEEYKNQLGTTMYTEGQYIFWMYTETYLDKENIPVADNIYLTPHEAFIIMKNQNLFCYEESVFTTCFFS
jgi:hypothetical protein